MVVSLKANRKRILAVLVLIAVVVGGFIIIPKLTTAPIKHYGETASQRIEFLESFGYQINSEPIDVRNVTIPKEFNDVYSKYNDMQKAQSFDLKPYKGKECTQYIYLIQNYPNTDKEIHATILVYNGVIIGGDVCCAEVDGFMHGFALDSARYGAGEDETSAASVASQISSETSQAASEASEGSAAADAQITDSAEQTDTQDTADNGTTADETYADGEENSDTETADAVDSDETANADQQSDADAANEDVYPTD